MVDILATILIIVFGLIVIFLAFSIISAVIYALSDFYQKGCLGHEIKEREENE